MQDSGHNDRLPAPQETWRTAFLHSLRQTANITKSAYAAGMTRQAVYDAMDRDGLFAAQVHDALEGLTDHMEASVYERGLTKSDTLALAWLRAKRPQEWGDKRTVEHNTTLNIHAVRELRQTFTVEELRALRDQTTEPESSQDGE